MSFIGACSGIHSAKQNEKARKDEMHLTQLHNQSKKQPLTTINNTTINNNNNNTQSSFHLFQLPFWNKFSHNNVNTINNSNPTNNNTQSNVSSNPVQSYFKSVRSSKPIISSRFQQQKNRYQ